MNFGFRAEDDLILLLELSSNFNAGLGTHEFSRDLQEPSHWLYKANEQGLINSYCYYSEAGLVISLIESCLIGQIGATVKVRAQGQPIMDVLFGTSNSCLLITVSPDNLIAFQDMAATNQNPVSVIGRVGGDSLSVSVASKQWDDPEEQEIIHLSLKELEDEWKSSSSPQMD
jgi:phosphoribosylformylglycinamidine (FGAM) synthase-like enzyme